MAQFSQKLQHFGRHFLFLFGNDSFFFWSFAWMLVIPMMREQTLISDFASRFYFGKIDTWEDINIHKALACKILSNNIGTIVEERDHEYFCLG